MKKLLGLFFGVALLFSTSAYSDVMVGVKAGTGELEGNAKAYGQYAAQSADKDSQFGAIFAEITLGDTGFSAGVEYIPLDADISLDGAGSSTSANVEDYTTAYLMYMHDTGDANLYVKAGYSQADIGTIKNAAGTTVNSQSSELEGVMVGAGIQTNEIGNGLFGRFEVTFTEIDDVQATTTSHSGTAVKKSADGELLTVTFGLSKSF
tara:strand:- start:284 stop:904 length:621 start_codon:yes stop_codon:yes gene_type:complete